MTPIVAIAGKGTNCPVSRYRHATLDAFHLLNLVFTEFRRALAATAEYQVLVGQSDLMPADIPREIYRRYYAEIARRCSKLSATIICLVVILWPPQAKAHAWYPRECCQVYDCAPVDNLTWLLPTNGGTPQLIVTSNRRKAIIPQGFPERESKDGRMHVCMQYDPFGDMQVICLFVPPRS